MVKLLTQTLGENSFILKHFKAVNSNFPSSMVKAKTPHGNPSLKTIPELRKSKISATVVKVFTKTSHGSLMKIGMVWGTRDGDPLGGLVLICREEISCAITTLSSCTKAGRSYRGGQKDLG